MQTLTMATAVSMYLLDDPIDATGDAAFDDSWDKVKHRSMLDVFRAERLWQLGIEASVLDGDFIECGAYRGATSCLLGLLIKHLGVDKKVYLLDSFAGMPQPAAERDAPHFYAGMLASELDACRALIRSLELEDIVRVVPGWFVDTLPGLPAGATFSLIHIDCDLYESTRVCLDWLYPRAASGAPVVFDDYLIQSPGERIAAQQLVARTRDTVELGPCTQAYLRKGQGYAARLRVADPEGQPLSCDDLSANEAYLDWLDDVIVHLHTSTAAVADLALTFR